MRIGYYFGAGISIETIPLANRLPDRIIQLANLLPTLDLFNNQDISPLNFGLNSKKPYLEILELMQKEWIEIGFLAKNLTIDTIAKEYIHDNLILNKIKRVLSSYFLIEQKKIFELPEYSEMNSPRIRKFLSDIFEIYDGSRLILKRNPIIFTWNYDIQFELAVSKHLKDITSDDNLIQACQQLINIAPRSSYRHPTDIESKSNHIIFKLNGTAGFHIPQEEYRKWPFIGSSILDKTHREYIIRILNNYAYMQANEEFDFTDIKFAFNNNIFLQKYEKSLDLYCNQIDRLYVMGYSFPVTNEEVDKELFSKMNNLKEIYIIDFESQADELIEKASVRSKLRKSQIKFSSNINYIPIYG